MNSKLNIITEDAPKLDLIISANDVDLDILSVSKVTTRNRLEEPFLQQHRDLGLNGILAIGVVQTARYAHPAMNGRLDGYGGNPADFIGDPDNTYQGYGNGVLTKYWGMNFGEKSFAFAAALGLNCDVIANPEHGTLEELLWQIEYYNAKRVFYGPEAATYMDGDTYKRIVSEWITEVKVKHPKILNILIPGLIYRENPKSLKLSNAVAEMDGDGINQYSQMADILEKENLFFSEDMEHNAELSAIFYSPGGPLETILDNCKKKFGEEKKLYFGEWNLKDRRKLANGEFPPDYINNTMLGMVCISRMIAFAIRNNDYLKYVAWMSLGNLIANDDSVSNNYLALRTAAKMVMGKKITRFEATGFSDDVEFTTVKDGRNHKVLINHSGTSETAIDEIYVDGKIVTVPVTKDGYFSTTWNSRIDTISFTGSGSVMIPSRSMQVIDFTV